MNTNNAKKERIPSNVLLLKATRCLINVNSGNTEKKIKKAAGFLLASANAHVYEKKLINNKKIIK